MLKGIIRTIKPLISINFRNIIPLICKFVVFFHITPKCLLIEDELIVNPTKPTIFTVYIVNVVLCVNVTVINLLSITKGTIFT